MSKLKDKFKTIQKTIILLVLLVLGLNASAQQVPGYEKVIRDITGVAWLLDSDWIPTEIRLSPMITEERNNSFSPTRHVIRSACNADREKYLVISLIKLPTIDIVVKLY